MFDRRLLLPGNKNDNNLSYLFGRLELIMVIFVNSSDVVEARSQTFEQSPIFANSDDSSNTPICLIVGFISILIAVLTIMIIINLSNKGKNLCHYLYIYLNIRQ